jgi:carboxylesterase type B
MAELPFTFDTGNQASEALNMTGFTPAEDAFSAQLLSWWGSFVNTGNPNTLANQPFQLPVYTPAGRELVVLNLTSTVENTTDLCGFWDTLGYFF